MADETGDEYVDRREDTDPGFGAVFDGDAEWAVRYDALVELVLRRDGELPGRRVSWSSWLSPPQTAARTPVCTTWRLRSTTARRTPSSTRPSSWPLTSAGPGAS
jgi:hypothetical protein